MLSLILPPCLLRSVDYRECAAIACNRITIKYNLDYNHQSIHSIFFLPEGNVAS